jgi:hypothetical protein
MLKNRPPSKKEAKGYDIAIWADKDGDIVSRAYTKKGDGALKGTVNTYEVGDIVQIFCAPPEFIADMPEDLVIGILTPTGLQRLRSKCLH